MKITKRQLKRLIKEFKVNPRYSEFFDFESGGGDLPPVEPPSNGGGGGGSGSNYPQVLVDKLVSDAMFESDAFIGAPESCSLDMHGCSLTVAGDNQTSTVLIMLSFLVFDAGYTDIVDNLTFECKDFLAVSDIYNGIMRLKNSLQNKTTAALNRELGRQGRGFIKRYMLNPNPGSEN